MTSSLVEARTRAFYEWELIGRGWISYDYPVALEPVFRPYLPHTRSPLPIDDGRMPTALSRLSDWVRRTPASTAHQIERTRHEEVPQPAAREDVDTAEWDLLALQDFDADESHVLSWLRTLSGFSEPASFAVVSAEGKIAISISCAERDSRRLTEQTAAHFPALRLRRTQQTLAQKWTDADVQMAGAVEFGLAREFMLPLSKGDSPVGLLTPMIGALARLSASDVGIYQVMFQHAGREWNREAMKSVFTENGDPFFADAEYVTELAIEKCNEPLLAVAIRICVGAQEHETAETVLIDLANTLGALGSANRNELTPLAAADIDQLIDDVLKGSTHRSGCLLSLSELIQLVQLPNPSIVSPLLVRGGGRTKSAPSSAFDRPFALGINEHEGSSRAVGLTVEDRLKHCYVIGASGTGKSSLLLNMVEQDLNAGHGLAVMDPHGDLIDEIIARVPDDRIGDVILFDPADSDFPVGFNVLKANSELERTLLSSDLVAVFRRFSTTFGDQMETVLANAILAFLERPEGGTLLDLRQFLLDKSFRDRCLSTVNDKEVIGYWRREFPLLRGNPQAAILTRLNGFLRPRTIRNMVAQQDSGIDMRSIMDGGKILLAKLSQGLIGEENSYILGSLLVTQISQAGASRQNTKASDRREFFLYLDEFHHFITPSITTILSGARKYGLGLTLAHQDLRQIKSRDHDLLSSVLGNAYTRVAFRVGEDDAKTLAAGLSFFESTDLQNLGTGECIARIERPAADFNLKTKRSSRVDSRVADHRRDSIIEHSRSEYATPRADVEEMLDGSHDGAPSSQNPEDDQPKESRRQGQRKKRSSVNSEPSSAPGRGGLQHKYLQSLVAKLGADCGFTPSIEKRVLEGHGHVDVALVRADVSIAFEISVSTSIEHEVGNLTKCLAAGFNFVVLLCQDVEQLAVARAFYSPTTDARVRFLMSDQLVAFFDEFKPAGGEATAKPGPPPTRGGGGGRAKAQPDAPTAKAATPESVAGKKRLMIARDAATYVGLAPQTLAKLRVVGGSPPYYKVGRQVMYDLAELDAWLSDRRKRSTSA